MKPQNLLIVLILFSIMGCKKLSGVDATNGNGRINEFGSITLVSKWQLVNDSTANSMVRTSALITNYNGVAGDYFDFRDDGKCYTKEGNTYDTLAYQLTSSKSITMQNFGLNINGVIEPGDIALTANSATITTKNMLTPGGTLFRMVNLKR
jgi:hypothetical protein